MINQRLLLGIACAVLLALAGCSRQQSDWQKTRETNTTDAYEQFLKKYPSGEFSAQAQARVKEMYEERDWQKARDADTPEAYQGFVKQYPEGKWTEEARIRIENFTLAQAPSGSSTEAVQGGESVVARGSAVAPATQPEMTKPLVTKPGATQSAATKPSAPAVAAVPRANAKRSSPGAKTYGVQLGAFQSGASVAKRRWARLRDQYPKLLVGLSSTINVKKTPTGALFRLQTTGLTHARAEEICRILKAKSQPCVIIR